MQSKTLSSNGRLFNAALFRKNLSRFWPLWGMASFLGALLPLALGLDLVRGAGTDLVPLEITEAYYAAVSYAVPVISLIYAVLCAMMVWSYLYSARSVGLMHTLPIRREGLFFTSFLSGMAMMLIPYAVTGGLCVVISACFGGFEPVGLCWTILGVAGISFFYFASATFVALVTGNLLALPVLYFLLHFMAVLADWLLSDLASGFIFGLTGGYSGVADVLSPTVYLMEKLGVDAVYSTVELPGRSGLFSQLESVTLINFWVVGVYVLAGLALLAAALLLYRRRRSERAGDVVSVEWLRPVFRYGVAALAALLGGRVLYALFWEQFQDGGVMDALPMTICMAVAGVIGYYAASMLLAKSLRVFRKSWLGPVAVTGAAALLCFSLQADLLGVADRVPEISQVKSVELYAAGNTYTFYPGEEDALLEQVRQLHAAIAADRDGIRETEESWRQNMAAGRAVYQHVRLTYRLSGGVTVERQYELYLTRERLARPGTCEQLLDQLVNSPEMKAKRLHVNDPHYAAQAAWVSGPSGGYYDLNSREAQALLDAVGRDAAAGAWGAYDWFGDERDAYAVDISVDFRGTEQNGGERSYDSIGITLRPEMTQTLDYLLEMGFLTEADLMTNEERYPYNYEEPWDGAEIQALENTALRETLAADSAPASGELESAVVLVGPAA